MDDMIQMLEKIKRPEHRESAKKQIALMAEIGDTAKGTVLYVLPKGVLCVLNTEEKPHKKK